MKILLTVPADISESNGTSKRAITIYNMLNHEHDTILIHSKSKRFDNLFIIFIDAILWNIKLTKTIISTDIDVVYMCSDWLVFVLLYLFSKIKKFKIVFEAHGILSEENIEKNSNKFIIKMSQLLEQFVIKKADYIIALSEKILNFYKVYNPQIEVIPPIINIKSERNPTVNESKIVGIIGPFDMPANKNYLNFLYKNLERFDERINFLIIGKCENKIKTHRIIYTGYLKSEEYKKKIESIDSLLVPAEIATSGPLNKILESMSLGIPVFTTPIGIIGIDLLENFKNVLCFNEPDLVKGVNENIFNDDLMLKISKNCRKIVEDYYGEDLNSKKLDYVIDSL